MSYFIIVRTVPPPPENVFIDRSKITASTVTVTWSPGGGDGETQWFFVNHREYDTTSTFDTNTRVRIPDGVYEHTVVGLRPYTVYEIEVYAENANGPSDYIKRVVTTLSTALPPPPEDVFIDDSKITTSTVTVTWSPGGEDGETQWFFVNHRENDTTSTFDTNTRARIPDGVYKHTVVGLRPYTVYEIEVYAENANGPSDYVKTIVTTRPEFVSTAAGATDSPANMPAVTNGPGNTGVTVGIAVLAVIATAGILIAVVGIIWYRRKASRTNSDIPMQSTSIFVTRDQDASPYATISESLAEFSRDQLTIMRELGQGEFGKVLLAKAAGIVQRGVVTHVAIKTIKDGAGPTERGDLLREMDFMKQLPSHANVVKLLGYCVDKDPVFIIMEYLAKGPLKNVLTESRGKVKQAYDNLHGSSKSLTSRELIKFARDVADGMAFLASQQCIHRDLAARNVLVAENMVCKVADFGLARDVKNFRVYQRRSKGLLPLRWMALESILDDVYSTKSDVWSYGVLLWEILTLGARPYPTMSTETMISRLVDGLRMRRPSHCQEEL
ncbi:fibroblast growth factor receptor 2-like [Patiria miniata]|uniref:receptor protein-tyrosine kinase n=1 Tax=Patiria miniata TaxID=46514 RepID=A0A914AMK0_PATMI|nr:fibroblast growth factor receptor 2-like [Patiria miniata]